MNYKIKRTFKVDNLVLNSVKMSNSELKSIGKFKLVLKLLLVLLFLQSCKSYKNSTMRAQASINNSKESVKVTMHNGDNFLYENIEIIDDQYYGVYVDNDNKIETLLIQEDIKSVRVYSNKTSLFTKLIY